MFIHGSSVLLSLAVSHSFPSRLPYLHDEFSAARHPSLRQQHVFRFLLLFSLLNLSQSADRVHALSVLWAGL